MMMLHLIYRTSIGWLAGSDNKSKSPKFADWMPADWSENVEPEKTGDVVENIDNFVRAVSR